MQHAVQTVGKVAIVGLLLGVLSGCGLVDWVKEKVGGSQASGAAIITFGSRAMFTESELQERIKLLLATQPQAEAVIKALPREEQIKLYENVAEELMNKILIAEYVKSAGLANSEEYKALAREAHKNLEYDLALEAFKQELLKEAAQRAQGKTEDDLKKFYDEQRALVAKQGEDKLKSFPSFEAVRPQLAEALKGQEFQKLCAERVAELRVKYDVNMNKDAIASLIPQSASAQAAASVDEQMPVDISDEAAEEIPVPAPVTPAV